MVFLTVCFVRFVDALKDAVAEVTLVVCSSRAFPINELTGAVAFAGDEASAYQF